MVRVQYKTAKLAKLKGFDEPCRHTININNQIDNSLDWTGENDFTVDDCVEHLGNGYGAVYLCPDQSQLQKWLREKHKIHIDVQAFGDAKDFPRFQSFKYKDSQDKIVHELSVISKDYKTLISESFETYEEALEHCLFSTLETLNPYTALVD